MRNGYFQAGSGHLWGLTGCLVLAGCCLTMNWKDRPLAACRNRQVKSQSLRLPGQPLNENTISSSSGSTTSSPSGKVAKNEPSFLAASTML